LGPACSSHRLAELWLTALDRAEVSRAANEIERLLRDDPAAHATHISEGLWKLVVPPLIALFEIRESDRIVEIARIDRGE